MPVPVLVVEDDALISSSLARALVSRGYEAEVRTTVADALAHLAQRPPALVLLDLGLPDGDGKELAEHLARHHPAIPVIILTARADEIDVIQGLEAGAVDYVTKPFGLPELLARVGSHLRQAAVYRAEGDDADRRVLRLGHLAIDTGARRVTVDDDEVALRPREFDLLARLARDSGTVVTREALIDDVWDENWWGSTHTLDVHINSLRRKLGSSLGPGVGISTVRGVGYRLDGGVG